MEHRTLVIISFLFCSMELLSQTTGIGSAKQGRQHNVSGYTSSHAAPVQQMQQFIGQKEYRQAWIGFHAVDVETGQTVVDLNSRMLMNPASLLKIVTSAAALELLGPGYRFQTWLGYTGRIENGVLHGDLVVRGGGDPVLGSEYFSDHYFTPHFTETWSQQIRAAGIRRVEGDLILDGSLYDSETVPPTWIWEDLGNYFGAGTNALSVCDNQLRITFRSPRKAGEATSITSIHPETEGFFWNNEVRSSDDPRDQAWVFGSPLDKIRTIRGTIPKNRRAFTIRAANPFPEELLGRELLKQLDHAAIFVTGALRYDLPPKDSLHEIFVTHSPPLKEIVRILNHRSVNLIAEHLVKQIAAETTGTGNREEGLHIIGRYWQQKGLDTESLVMEDGSGLSPLNAVTPAFITSVLRYMASGSPASELFIRSMPSAGEGTLSRFSATNFPETTLKAKSGSMTRVQCYAGYLRTDSGRTTAFAFMINNFAGSHQKLIPEVEKILLELKNTDAIPSAP